MRTIELPHATAQAVAKPHEGRTVEVVVHLNWFPPLTMDQILANVAARERGEPEPHEDPNLIAVRIPVYDEPPPAPVVEDRERQIADAVEALLDVAVERHTENRDDGETFEQCHLCGKWEEHEPTCPVPLLRAWLDC